MTEDVFARTLYGEARGEGKVGMHAVANVVMNRAALAKKHPHFGNGTPESACLAHAQFSCWNVNDPNLSKIQNVTTDDPSFQQAVWLASDASNGVLDDITGGATYYYVAGSPEPSWAEDQVPCCAIGKHLFYRDIL